MQTDKIYQEIGSLIWSIFPQEAIEAIFQVTLYELHRDEEFHWILEDGTEKTHGFNDEFPDEVTDKIVELLQELQKDKIFEKEQWTHCKVSLTNDQKFNIEFKYVKEEDSWPGLFMKGVSGLTYEEVRKHCNIPKKEWKKRQILYGKES